MYVIGRAAGGGGSELGGPGGGSEAEGPQRISVHELSPPSRSGSRRQRAPRVALRRRLAGNELG